MLLQVLKFYFQECNQKALVLPAPVKQETFLLGTISYLKLKTTLHSSCLSRTKINECTIGSYWYTCHTKSMTLKKKSAKGMDHLQYFIHQQLPVYIQLWTHTHKLIKGHIRSLLKQHLCTSSTIWKKVPW